jgi:hypothetical protein
LEQYFINDETIIYKLALHCGYKHWDLRMLNQNTKHQTKTVPEHRFNDEHFSGVRISSFHRFLLIFTIAVLDISDYNHLLGTKDSTED